MMKRCNPKFTSQKCSNCGHIERANRHKERFVCTNCNFIEDADLQAAVNIGLKGLKTLGISPSKLLRETQKVTSKNSELTEITANKKSSKEISMTLGVEPGNPAQLMLFQWMNS